MSAEEAEAPGATPTGTRPQPPRQGDAKTRRTSRGDEETTVPFRSEAAGDFSDEHVKLRRSNDERDETRARFTDDSVFSSPRSQKRPISYPCGSEYEKADDASSGLFNPRKRYSDPPRPVTTAPTRPKAQVKPFTKESLERLERKTVQLVREYGFQPRRKLSVEDGARLPAKYEPFPPKLYGRPLEEIDNFIYDEFLHSRILQIVTMNIKCFGCSELYTPESVVYTTKCGHLFHLTCLMQEMCRSNTCPQCYCGITHDSIRRVFFNFKNHEGNPGDTTLQCQVDTLKLQLSQLEERKKIYLDKHANTRKQHSELRNEVDDLLTKISRLDSIIDPLKVQMPVLKIKAKEGERLNGEVLRMKERIRELEHIQTAINKTKEQVNGMPMHNRDSHSLSILVIQLKKDLVEADRRHKQTLKNTKHIQDDIIRRRKELPDIKQENSRITTELEIGTLEMQRLREKLQMDPANVHEL